MSLYDQLDLLECKDLQAFVEKLVQDDGDKKDEKIDEKKDEKKTE